MWCLAEIDTHFHKCIMCPAWGSPHAHFGQIRPPSWTRRIDLPDGQHQQVTLPRTGAVSVAKYLVDEGWQGYMDDPLLALVFYVLAAVSVVSALAVVALRSIVRSAFALVVAFVGVAGIYVLLSADFVAAVQVLIYAGAIAVLLLFAIMLTKMPWLEP